MIWHTNDELGRIYKGSGCGQFKYNLDTCHKIFRSGQLLSWPRLGSRTSLNEDLEGYRYGIPSGAYYYEVLKLKSNNGKVGKQHHPKYSVDLMTNVLIEGKVHLRNMFHTCDLGSRIFSSPRRPDRLWDPPSLLSNGYRLLFPRR
jgi:hypothetical protein